MNKFQLIAYSGITIGFVDAITPTGAIEIYRNSIEQMEEKYDWMYEYYYEGNKIIFKNKKEPKT